MSIQATAWAWSAPVESTGLLVLLALADMAGTDDARTVSMQYLSDKTRLSKRTVGICLLNLSDDGLIKYTRLEGGRVWYRVLMAEGAVT